MQIFRILTFLPVIIMISCTTKEKPAPVKEKIQTKLIMSDININFITLGSYVGTFFTIPNPSKDKITFEKVSIPNGVKTYLQPKGISNIIITPTEITDNPLVTKIIARSQFATDSIEFKTKVVKVKGNIFYAAPKNSKRIGKKIGGHTLMSINQILTQTANNIKHTTIFLTSGKYQSLLIDNAKDLTIIPKIAESPSFAKINITHSRNCTFQGLTISSENAKGKSSYYIQIDSTSSDIIVRNCLIQAANKTEIWEPKDWKNKASNGIYSKGENCIFQHNLIRNIHHGLETKGDNNVVTNNIIVRFAGDAIRNTGNNNVFAENYLADAVVDDYSAKDGNHDDLFQSWTFDKPIKNLIIQNNIAINCTDTTIHLQSKNVQGLACFDGFEENWKIENNLVILEHPHGIALFGANNCQVINNKVIPNPFNKYDFESAPWIMIHDHKDGRLSLNNMIINNLVSVLKIDDAAATIKGNTIIDSIPTKTFPKYAHWVFE